MTKNVYVSAVLIAAFAFLFSATPAAASHSWGGYHWARTNNPFTLKLGDNLNGTWRPYLTTTSTNWSVSSVLDTVVSTGASNRNCRATNGQVEVCNAKYGYNGWLGIAQIWITGGEHITQGTTKLNDSYFSSSSYNSPAWRNLVMCQEVGHTFGLDHQDETFDNANLNTCMDYTNNPASNQQPNAHDYEELETIYGHIDSFATLSSLTSGGNRNNSPFLVGQGDFDNASEWGRKIRDNGYVAVFERDFGMGNKLLTHVIWPVESPRVTHAE